MITILQITGTREGYAGGVNNVVLGLSKELNKQGYNSKIIYGYGQDGYVKTLAKLIRKFDLLIAPCLLKRKITNLLKSEKVALVHFHGADAIYDGARIANWLKKRKIKTIATLHGLDREMRDVLWQEIRLQKRMFFKCFFQLMYFNLSARKEQYAYKKMDQLLAVSPGIKTQLNNYYSLFATVLPNASADYKKTKPSYTRKLLGIDPQEKVVLFVGVSSWVKGYQYFKQIINNKNSYLVVGIKLKGNLPKNVINLPYVSAEKIDQLFNLADVYVHTAVSESFGLVYLEAMKNKVPIVSFKTHGTDLLLRNSVNGLVVPDRDTASLSLAIEKVLTDNIFCRQIIANGTKTVNAYSFVKSASLLTGFYQQLLQQKNYLLIPHLVKNNNRTRTEEIARALVRRGEKVFLLYWGERKEKKYGISLTNLVYFFKEFLRIKRTGYYFGVKKIFLPRLVFPINMATVFNSWQINGFIKKNNITDVINAAFFYYKINNQKIEYVYDLVDDHVAYTNKNGRRGSVALAVKMAEYITGEMGKAKKVLFVSQILKNKYPQYAAKGTVLFNGAYFADNNLEQEALKEKYGLGKKYVFGLIGNHGEWSGLETIISIFKKHQLQLKNAILLIVGNVYSQKLVANLPPNIKYLGALPPEKIEEIYSLIDTGLQAAIDDEFRQKTIPLKVMEYTIAKKMVVALEARNLKQLDLPNLLIAKRNDADIVAKLVKCKSLKWQPQWDKKASAYNWDNLIKKI